MTTEARIDPLQGGTETSLRFLFLAVTTLTASMYAWQYLHFRYVDPAPVGLLECTQQSSTGPAPPYSSDLAQCWAEIIAHPTALTLLLSSLATIVVTLAAVPLLAVGYLRSRGIRALPAQHSAVRDRIDELSRALGAPEPRVVIEPAGAATARMLSDGRRPPLLVLRLGMLQAFRSEPVSFDAVVAHEFGHLTNRDVLRAQLAIAAWWTLTICVVLPYSVGSFTKWSSLNSAPLLKFVVLLVVARWLRDATLRAREYEADVVAARSPSRRAALQELLRRAVTPGKLPRRGLQLTHPPPGRRLEVLKSPGTLLRASMFDVACLGALAYFSAPALVFLWNQVFYGRSAMTHAPTAAAATIGVIAGAGLWRIAWRDAIAHRYVRRVPWQPLRAAAALFAGAVVGANLVPTIGANAHGFTSSHSLTEVAVKLLPAAVGATLSAAFAFGLARLVAARTRTRTSMLVLRTVGSAAVAGCCAVILYWANLSVDVLTTAPTLVREALIFSTLGTLLETWVRFVLVGLGVVVAVLLALRKNSALDRLAWLFTSGLPGTAEPTEAASA